MGKLGFDPLQLVDYVVDDVSRLQMFGQDIPCIDFDLDLGRQAISTWADRRASSYPRKTLIRSAASRQYSKFPITGELRAPIAPCHSGLAFVHGGRPVDWR
jgi:hypothetical protein